MTGLKELLILQLFKLIHMYGKLHERKLKESDFLLSCEEARKQLDEYMDNESKRVNVDSAKKLAVLQHMDYEGFRQMVLGANIFSTKSKELYTFSKGVENSTNPNKLFDEKKQNQEIRAVQRSIEGNSEKHCFNFRDFKKKFMKFYDKELSWEKAEECYSLTKEQNKARLQRIFNLECEADILLKIVEVFTFVIDYMQKEQAQSLKVQVSFTLKFLQAVLMITTMQSISLNILTKKQKEKIASYIDHCKNILNDESALEIIALLKK